MERRLPFTRRCDTKLIISDRGSCLREQAIFPKSLLKRKKGTSIFDSFHSIQSYILSSHSSVSFLGCSLRNVSTRSLLFSSKRSCFYQLLGEASRDTRNRGTFFLVLYWGTPGKACSFAIVSASIMAVVSYAMSLWETCCKQGLAEVSSITMFCLWKMFSLQYGTFASR